MKENKLEKLWKKSWTYIKTVVDVVHEPVLILDDHFRVMTANESFYQVFKVNQKETENKIIELAKKTGCVVSIEEHQIFGGVGGAVSELLSKKYPIPMEFVGVKDSFGKSGLYSDLIKKYNLDSASIIESVMKVIKRKKF